MNLEEEWGRKTILKLLFEEAQQPCRRRRRSAWEGPAKVAAGPCPINSETTMMHFQVAAGTEDSQCQLQANQILALFSLQFVCLSRDSIALALFFFIELMPTFNNSRDMLLPLYFGKWILMTILISSDSQIPGKMPGAQDKLAFCAVYCCAQSRVRCGW